MREIQLKGIPAVWRKSRITPLYKQKGDSLNCSNYKGIKLLSQCLKLWERIIESRLRDIVEISKRQYGFQKYSVYGCFKKRCENINYTYT